MYIKVNGSRVWPNSSATPISPGHTVTISKSFHLDQDTMTIELVDEDTEPIDPDDSLGTHTVRSSEQGQGQREAKFTGSGSQYSLFYTVT
ncbi:hypothetical protein ACIBKY_35225 [Nonomuraea sp. NPDC050394]|uniref:hypothetical protein n=1 Tax=Nonomuraea sp. NPDC050394 TaxID=3364363 RepID=UPI0037AFA640